MIRTLIKVKNKIINKLIAITLLYMIIIQSISLSISEYYNKIFNLQNHNFLAKESIDLIILTVTGDKRFNSIEINHLFQSLQIIHLLVLSGSNIGILIIFLSYFSSKDDLTYIFIYFLALFYYFCYICFLHPVARALIFYTIYEIISNRGYNSKSLPKVLIISIFSIYVYISLNYSNSFLLSYIFSLLIILYGFLQRILHIKEGFVSKFLIFPVYMTFASLPVSLYFFKSYSTAKSFFI